MGSEIIFPIAIAGKWGLIIAAGLGLIYASLFRYGKSSEICRQGLRAILFVFAIMLFVPTTLAVLAIPIWIFAAIFGGIEPFSDRFAFAGVAIVLGSIVAAAWWGLLALFSHLRKSMPS